MIIYLSSLLGASLLGTGQNAAATLGGAGGGLLEHSLGSLGDAGDVLTRDAALGGLASHLTRGGAGHCDSDCYLFCYTVFRKMTTKTRCR
jgi:hypothetical protein